MFKTLKTAVLAAAVALSFGSAMTTSASAYIISGGHGPGHFGPGHFGGGWGGGYHWGGYRWGGGFYRGYWPYRYGYGFGYPVVYSDCLPGTHRNYWGHCVPNFRPF